LLVSESGFAKTASWFTHLQGEELIHDAHNLGAVELLRDVVRLFELVVRLDAANVRLWVHDLLEAGRAHGSTGFDDISTQRA
jgi:hypothetical protein